MCINPIHILKKDPIGIQFYVGWNDKVLKL